MHHLLLLFHLGFLENDGGSERLRFRLSLDLPHLFFPFPTLPQSHRLPALIFHRAYHCAIPLYLASATSSHVHPHITQPLHHSTSIPNSSVLRREHNNTHLVFSLLSLLSPRLFPRRPMSSVSSPELLNPATTTIMLSVSLSPAFTVLAGVALIFVAACAFAPARLLRWFQRKRYQYEVTFSLYMLTPTEKFVFSECLLLLPWSWAWAWANVVSR